MAKYVGKKGDTLGKLARRYGLTKKQLRKLNPDVKFGKRKSKGGKGFRALKGQEIRLGKGVGQPRWKAELLQDPKYSAFLRQFDYDKDKLNNDFIETKNRQARDLARQEDIFREDLINRHRGIDRDSSSRGMFRSGERARTRGRATNELNAERQRFIDIQGEDREEARRNKREAIAGLKRDKMEEKLAARERLTLRDANTEYGYG